MGASFLWLLDVQKRNGCCTLVVALLVFNLAYLASCKTDCQLSQEEDLSYERFMSEYYDKRPLLWKGGATNWSSLSWDAEAFVQRYGQFQIQLRDAEQLTVLGRRARVVEAMNVQDYVASLDSQSLPLFDNRFTPLTRALLLDLRLRELPLRVVRDQPIVSIGNKGTGVGFHAHSENWIAQLGGRKLWFLVDKDSPYQPERDPNPCKYLKNLPKGNFKIKRCLVRPNDVIYLPGGWAHATCNLDRWTLGVGGQSTIATRSKINVAVLDDDDDIVRALVSKRGKAALYEMDQDGDTPARLAAMIGNASKLALLAELGVNFDKDEKSRSRDSGRSVINEAASYGHTDAIDWLLKHGMSPNFRGSDGSTPAHHACLNSHVNVIQLLMAHPDINMALANADGYTPMHNAVRSCNKEIMVLILPKFPQTLLHRTKSGKTPVELARYEGCDQTPLLEKAEELVRRKMNSKSATAEL